MTKMDKLLARWRRAIKLNVAEAARAEDEISARQSTERIVSISRHMSTLIRGTAGYIYMPR